jgi:pyruvate formate lyase activating enzyme
MDIKASPQNQIYKSILAEGVKLSDIEESVKILKNSNIDFEFRTTVVNTIHKKEEFLEIAEWIGGENVKYYLQNFLPTKTIDPEFEKVKPFPKEFLENIVKEISPFFKVCQVR